MTVTFDGLGISSALTTALSAQGITEPFPIQARTIGDVLAGRDVCGKAKTGSGKTLAFGLPLLQQTGRSVPGAPRTLVLVPTRELALQVRDVLAPLADVVDRRVAAFYGGAPLERQVVSLREGVDLAVATPGRLIDLHDRGDITLESLEAIVLDEADRMADMGFMPQVEWLLRRADRPHQTLLFSATLDGDVNYLVRHYLNDPVRHDVTSDQVTVEEMEHRFLAVHQLDKVKVAAAISRGVDKSMFFTRTKRGADNLARQLAKEGVKAAPIHGDLPQRIRERSLSNFAQGRLPALVATDVAARGLDIDAVDVVVHYDPPEDHKGYLHRSGRTARAGVEGIVVTLVLWDQVLEVEKIQRRVGLQVPIVEVFSNDERLADLAGWKPDEDAA